MKNELIMTMLGYQPDVLHQLIVTPLRSLYEQIIQQFPSSTKHKGFYDSAEIADSCLIVCIPQGIQGQDICCLFDNCKIALFGYAGGLSEKTKIGEIYEAESAVSPDGKRYKLTRSTALPSLVCGYSPSMLGTPAESFTMLGRQLHCDAVDMETVYCASAAEQHQHSFSSILLITDKPGNNNFWELNVAEQNAVALGRKKLVKNAVALCKEMIQNELS